MASEESGARQEDGPRGWRASRRELVALGGAAGAGLYLERSLVFGTKRGQGRQNGGKPSTPQFTATIRRREDHLWLRFTFVNLVLKSTKPPKLVRAKAGQAAFVIVSFGPQHLAEQAYFVASGRGASEHPPPPGKSRARLADASRLAFQLPKHVTSIPYDLQHLLDWAALAPSLVPAATAIKKPTGHSRFLGALRAPQSTETAIELPWRLALSPTGSGEWAHDLAPVDPSGTGWVELWHTRLGHQVPASAAQKATPGPTKRQEGGSVRAVWAYDKSFKKSGEPPDHDNQPFRTSLDARDRTQIVRASSDVRVNGRADVKAQRLWLSSLGGFLDARGFWDLKSLDLSLEEWRHQATLGRDHYVRVVEKGFLFPFGHKAVRIKVTERRFEKVGTSKVVAVMRQHVFLVVRQPLKAYGNGGSYGVTNDGRDLPFRSIRITTLVSPDLDDPVKDPFTPNVKTAFVPKVGGVPFRFHMVGTDWVGRDVEFTAPAVFVDSGKAFKGPQGPALGAAGIVRQAYNDLPPDHVVRTGVFTGQTVALAASLATGDTDVQVNTIAFGARAGKDATDTQYLNHDQPRCYPVLAEAAVRFGAAEQASGGKPLSKVPVIQYDGTYVAQAFDEAANKGKVFVKVKPDAVPKIDFGGGTSGGVLTPNIAIGGLSRSLGTVGGNPDTVRDGSFDPAEFFKGAAAKILGGVDLLKLIAPVPLSGDSAPDQALKLSYRTTPDALETSLVWKPDIVDNPIVKKEPSGFHFEIDGKIRTDLQDPTKSTFDVLGDLRGFSVNLLGEPGTEFIVIHFNSLRFTAKTGQSSDVKVDIASVNFVGVLEFVEKLKEFLSFGGGDGPAIDVTPTGISADLSVPIPDIQVGVFGISNIALNAGFNLPFSGDPARFRFGFSTREDQFALQVAIFGGGGFFGIAIGTDGVEQIEAALEFGAMCSIDIGVASGGVHLLAGVYFSYGIDDTHPDPTCVLTGYVRMGGELSVLGIISLSLEFYMGLTYESGPPKKVYGQATLTVEISILCFSVSVGMTVERQFGGQDGDPTFAQQIPPTLPDGSHPWDDYCDAFAEN